MNGVEKYVREAMPIQEEKRASGKPAAKARPRLKPSSTSNWNFTPMAQRKWIDVEVKKIQGPLLLPDVIISLLNCFDTRKLVEKKMLEFFLVELLRNASKFCQRIQDIGQTK